MIGKTFSHLRILDQLGKGGMGEVYLAQDSKLRRKVAVKVLPQDLAGDPERLERFGREARTLAALNHPRIVTIHSVEEIDGIHLLTMEHVKGRSLDKLLPKAGFALDKLFALGAQIADGLAAAHEKDIIHRDLKPANVMVTEEGRVKILDFGLAKPVEVAGDDAETEFLTQEGTLLGTPQYMSPEQVGNESVDHRTDIFSLGILLYEMATGRRPFRGENQASVISAVLRDVPPPVTDLKAELPNHLGRIVRRCLEKDRGHRYPSAREVQIELERLEKELAASPQRVEGPDGRTANGVSPRPRRLGALVAAGVGVLLLVAGGFLVGRAFAPTDQSGESKSALKLDLELEGFTFQDLGEEHDGPKISPDGQQLLYPTADGLRIRRLTELDAVALPATEGASYAFWSPDGGSIAYTKAGRLWRRPVSGGPATELGPIPEDLFGSGGGAWNSAGQLVLAGSPSEGLVGFSGDGRGLGELLAIAEGEADFHEISPLPGNRGFLFTVHGQDGIDTIAALVDGQRKEILRLPGEALAYPSYSPTGHLLYERETTNPGLWAARFSLERTEVLGAPFLVLANATMPSRANDGTLVFVRRDQHPAELVKVGRNGSVQPLLALSAPARAGSLGWLDLSPDGRRVAVPLDARPYGDLWVVDLGSGTQARLDRGWVGSIRPVWMPDSSRLVYGSLRGTRTTWKAWIGSADGMEEPKKLRLGDADIVFPLAVSPDGEWLIFSPPEDLLVAIRIENPTEKLTIARDTGRNTVPAANLSRDGNWLAYKTEESGSPAVWAQPFPPDGRRWPVSTEQGAQPRWSPSGAELFYRSGPRMMAVGFGPGREPPVSRPRELFSLPEDSGLSVDFEPLSDDEGFLMVRSHGSQRITVVFDLDSLIAEAEKAQRAPS